MATWLDTPTPGWPPPDGDPNGGLLSPQELAALSLAPKAGRLGGAVSPAQQWWNFPAKLAAGKQIAGEEADKFSGHHNDIGDAMRHAEWSQRMATEIDPAFSRAVGRYHEGDNIATNAAKAAAAFLTNGASPGLHGFAPSTRQTLAESRMDLHNNEVGLEAARRGLAIDPQDLIKAPTTLNGDPRGRGDRDPYDAARHRPYEK